MKAKAARISVLGGAYVGIQKSILRSA